MKQATITRTLNGQPYADEEWGIESTEQISADTAKYILHADYDLAGECQSSKLWWIGEAVPTNATLNVQPSQMVLTIDLSDGSQYIETAIF